MCKIKLSVFVVSLLYVFYSCTYQPYKATNREYKKEVKALTKLLRTNPAGWMSDSILQPGFAAYAINFNLRKPNYVIIHHTAQNSCAQTLKTFTLKRTQVSAHYVICRDGTVHHMLNDYFRGWHAGAGSWKGNTDINSSSIGIELDNNGTEPFPDAQINSLISLLSRLKSNYTIPVANIIGHADIAPTRKNDPSVNFPWSKLAKSGFGQWYGDTTGVVLPDNFQTFKSLRLIGYDVKDTTAALRAFKRHWIQTESQELTEADKKIMFLLEEGR